MYCVFPVSRQLRAMLVNVIELRASNWGRNETDRTVGAGDSMNGRASGTNWRVMMIVVVNNTPEPRYNAVFWCHFPTCAIARSTLY